MKERIEYDNIKYIIDICPRCKGSACFDYEEGELVMKCVACGFFEKLKIPEESIKRAGRPRLKQLQSSDEIKKIMETNGT